ncbi:MAG TPA: hypothetical protein VHC86_10790 [Opitutaceae bacterium]|nr:hypothetical protein [Opitutaceae bacterium]
MTRPHLALLALGLAPLAAARGQPEGPAPWREGALPNYRIYADAPAEEVDPLVRSVAVVERDFSVLWPARGLAGAPAGILVFCLGSADMFRLIPPGPPGRAYPSGWASDYIISAGKGDRAMDCLWAGPSGGPVAAHLGQHRLQQAYRDYFLSALGERVPPWLSQGLGKLVAGMYCTEGGIEFQPLASDATLAIRERTRGSVQSLEEALRAGTFIPLERLLAETDPPKPRRAHQVVAVGRGGGAEHAWVVGPDNRAFWAGLEYGPFIDEAYEFCLFGLIGEDGKYRERFIRFAEAASNGPLDEAGFQRIFGADYRTLQLELWRYTGAAHDQTVRFKPGPGLPPVAQPHFLPMAEEEVRKMASEWGQRGTNRPAPEEDDSESAGP